MSLGSRILTGLTCTTRETNMTSLYAAANMSTGELNKAAATTNIPPIAKVISPFNDRQPFAPPPDILDFGEALLGSPVDAVAALPGPFLAQGKGVVNPAPVNSVVGEPRAGWKKGHTAEVTALKCQLAMISKQNYNAAPITGELGKYYIPAAVLIKQGYANSTQLLLSSSWNSKDGITGIRNFLLAKSVQERIMDTWLETSFNELLVERVPIDLSETVVALGVVAVAIRTSVPNAVKWVTTGVQTTGLEVAAYVQAKYAVEMLRPKLV